jgi:hypothetical protein
VVAAVAAVAAVLVVATVLGGGAADPSDAQVGAVTSSTIGLNPVPSTIAPSLTPAGRIAWVTRGGDVVVARSDGSEPRTVGSGAVADSQGLAPLAWSGGGDLVAYVRKDGALVLASTDGSEQPIVAATDAVVSAQAEEPILSFDSSGSTVAYLESAPHGGTQAAVAVYDGDPAGTVTPLTDPVRRIPTSFQFSPIDPMLFLQSLDADTGQRQSLAFVDPFTHTPVGSPIAVRDPVFSPDGAYLFGVIHAGLDQLIRVNVQTAKVDFVRDQSRICHPQPSPDGTRVAYGSGRNCNELWTVHPDGTRPRRVARVLGRGNTFAAGAFSWSLDGTIVSHPACNEAAGDAIRCGGQYLDVDVASGTVTRRSDVGNVVREHRPLIKPLKVKVEVTGPLHYEGGMVVPTGSQSDAPKLTQLPHDAIIKVTAADERDERRSVDLELLTTQDSHYVVGTIHIVDPAARFDHQLTVFGQVAAQSARYARFRGIWLQTSAMPFRSGLVDLTVYR